ncbi:unnamed protein product [Protopolystoma xenopodis]|uniref:Cyanocobalamin reductase (cyanide-eliminating) n=1 Tax=Protopolystoma xenopodis TaxID=117903 RepID=A0A3S5ATP3_9PLAT|nr:unnamed protein product [Protopolystoma xenopodis]
MFELSFLPHLDYIYDCTNLQLICKDMTKGIRPVRGNFLDTSIYVRIDSCLSDLYNQSANDSHAKSFFKNIHFVPDYDINPVTWMPAVHLQTAGHISGLAYYHRIEEASSNDSSHFNDRIKHSRKLAGVSLHPVYGGWFAFRGILILPDVICSDLPRNEPLSSLPPFKPPFRSEDVLRLLNEFNSNWREATWRNFGLEREDPFHKYSPTALRYFSSLPNDRGKLVESFLDR